MKWRNDIPCGKRKHADSASFSRCSFRSVRYLEEEYVAKTLWCQECSVRCSEFRGVCFSEVANVLQIWDFEFVTRTLSALGSVSASRSVHSERFDCNWHTCFDSSGVEYSTSSII